MSYQFKSFDLNIKPRKSKISLDITVSLCAYLFPFLYQALFSKGVSNEDAEKAVKLVFNDAEASGDQESKFGMSKHSMDHLVVQASKQWLRSHDASIEIRKSRIIRWLQYRGFGWDIIGAVVKTLEAKYPP